MGAPINQALNIPAPESTFTAIITNTLGGLLGQLVQNNAQDVSAISNWIASNLVQAAGQISPDGIPSNTSGDNALAQPTPLTLPTSIAGLTAMDIIWLISAL